ncbi:class I SAM-dependent methyltransferase [Acaryochloris marina]|uniref:class I SAM-dependent methyltransferase n=1 Tax=Acaryochloris marina TaxID=155978 RepID=UPI0021C2EA5F|nr:class I SAM-dependent methyltransferase [Acaryochloris marina]BDM77393.1 O-methyltransferase [Acaryochloris marina MBIC10699]
MWKRRNHKNIGLSDTLYHYLQSISLRESQLLNQLRQETAKRRDGMMQIAPDQGQLMALLIQLMGAKNGIEIGTFTGYSTLWLALALPIDGWIITCDVNEKTAAVARRYWQQAGLADKIDLRIAPATKTLQQLLASGQSGTFDFAFIDADKPNYPTYYEQCLQLLRAGGLIIIDNVLWGGKVAQPMMQDHNTRAIRALNECLHQDKRVDISTLGIADGITLARKR